MNKKVAVLLLVLVIIGMFLVVACGSPKPSDPPTESSSIQGVQTAVPPPQQANPGAPPR